MRDPTQVFMLLEAIYSAFDVIARRRGVFKVETIGDSYVAVTGLPDPQRDHALIMARFARDCRIRFKEITRTLELALGPDTGDLCMRFGMHSGPYVQNPLKLPWLITLFPFIGHCWGSTWRKEQIPAFW